MIGRPGPTGYTVGMQMDRSYASTADSHATVPPISVRAGQC